MKNLKYILCSIILLLSGCSTGAPQITINSISEFPNSVVPTVENILNYIDYTIEDNTTDTSAIKLDVEGEYSSDYLEPGSYELKLVATDSDDNSSYKVFEFTVVESEPFENILFEVQDESYRVIFDDVASADSYTIRINDVVLKNYYKNDIEFTFDDIEELILDNKLCETNYTVTLSVESDIFNDIPIDVGEISDSNLCYIENNDLGNEYIENYLETLVAKDPEVIYDGVRYNTRIDGNLEQLSYSNNTLNYLLSYDGYYLLYDYNFDENIGTYSLLDDSFNGGQVKSYDTYEGLVDALVDNGAMSITGYDAWGPDSPLIFYFIDLVDYMVS